MWEAGSGGLPLASTNWTPQPGMMTQPIPGANANVQMFQISDNSMIPERPAVSPDTQVMHSPSNDNFVHRQRETAGQTVEPMGVKVHNIALWSGMTGAQQQYAMELWETAKPINISPPVRVTQSAILERTPNNEINMYARQHRSENQLVMNATMRQQEGRTAVQPEVNSLD